MPLTATPAYRNVQSSSDHLPKPFQENSVIQTKDLNIIKKIIAERKLEKNRLIIALDLDNTVIKTKEYLGSARWHDKAAKEIKDEKLPPEQEKRARAALKNEFLKYDAQAEILPTQDDMAKLIADLQKGAIVLALTARTKASVDTTLKHLKTLGIDFSKQWSHLGECKLSDDRTMYKDGVVFCDLVNKGIVFENFITHKDNIKIRNEISVTIFSDDKF